MNFLRRYRLDKKIGEGGMGVVYKALDRLSGQQVALKQVNVPGQVDVHSQTSIDIRLALAEEFHTLASLRHPNIISVLDYGFDESLQPFFTMDLLEGTQSIVAAGKDRPESVRFGLLSQALQALVYLHRRKIIHRDLKPGNILVAEGDQVKVLDFGLAHSVLDKNAKRPTAGTIPYMSPEILQGDAASEGSDLYAMGVIGFEMIMGDHPFSGKAITDMIALIRDQGIDSSLLPKDSPYTPIVARLLAYNVEDRYTSALDAIHALAAVSDSSVPIETIPIRESFLQAATFIGRDTERDMLIEALGKEAKETTPKFWLIGGESGVGKSRLLEEVRTPLLVQSIYVLRGQGVTDGRPYHLWLEIARWLSLEKDLPMLDARVLKALVPDIMAIRQQLIGDPPPLDAQATRERLIQTLQNLLIQQTQPVLLMLEDIHWADEESLQLLSNLTTPPNGSNLRIICTYRDDESPDFPKRFPGLELMKLKRLSPENVNALSTAILGERGQDAQLISFLQRETEGNALFLVEVMRVLAENSGTLEEIRGEMLPANVEARGVKSIIRRRLAQIPAEARDYLNLAAVLGREIELAVLRAFNLAVNWENWLNICADYAILEVQNERWRFAHDKLRETVLSDIEKDPSRALHQDAARALQTAYGDTPALAARLAYHWNLAGEYDRERDCSIIAGEHALLNGAPVEAARLLNRALELGVSDTFTRAALEYKLCDAFYGGNELDASNEHARRALRLLGYYSPRRSWTVVPYIVYQLVRQVVHRIIPLRYQQQHNKAAFEREKIAARAFDRIAFAEYLANRPMIATGNGLSALNVNERLGSSAELARSYAMTSIASSLVHSSRIAQYYLKMGFEAAGDDPVALGQVFGVAGVYWFGQGDFEKATSFFMRALATAEQTGNPRVKPDNYYLRTIASYFAGDFDLCLEMARACYEADMSIGVSVSAHPEAIYEIAIGLLQNRLLDVGEQIPGLLQIMEQTQLGDHIVCIAMLCEWRLIQGDKEAAHKLAMEGLNIAQKSLPTIFSNMLGFITLGEIFTRWWEGGDASQEKYALQMSKILRTFASFFPVAVPSARRIAGLCLWLQGKHEQAQTTWVEGLAIAERLQTKYEIALLHYEIARHLPEGDPQRETHTSAAIQGFEAVGAVTMLNRLRGFEVIEITL